MYKTKGRLIFLCALFVCFAAVDLYLFIHSYYIPWILVGKKKPDRCGISLHIHIINSINYIYLESMCHIKTITIFINSSGNKIKYTK
jgi:hypothetical protein